MNKGKIKILPDNIANKIAAGEVVQRPESVVKELLENSLDSGADTIELMVKKAGKQLIQVCDNGSGMSEEDARLCILKHATSKIFTYDDLESIRTFGFRGEALSSIAAVSQLEIKTEMKDEELGTYIKLEDDGIHSQKGSFPKGTMVIVKNLFYNTPARRNFLKSDSTELKHIIDIFNKIALSNPTVHFSFYNDDNLIFDYTPGSHEDRIKQVFADNMLDALLAVEEKTEYLTTYGYIGKPSMLTKSKGEQYVFINGRYVISRQINHAVFTAYENFLEKGDYPFFILFIELDPEKTDVNIHPSKLEVRFNDERDIYNFVLAVVRKGLGSHDLIPNMAFTERVESTEKINFDHYTSVKRDDFSDRPVFPATPTSRTDFSDKEIDLLFSSIPDKFVKADENGPHPFEINNTSKVEILHSQTNVSSNGVKGEESPFIIQLHNKYILSQIKTGLMIIDQHVAHERILYEKALNRFDANLPFSQQLLFPKTLEVDPGTFGLIKELYQYLVKLGFEIKFFSKNTIVIEGVPDDLTKGAEEKVLLEILHEYVVNLREKGLEERENLAKSYSCKTAIKAGDKLNEKEMRLLIDQLFATSMPYVCPHGRPVVIKISLDEFDRRFGRT